MTQFAVGKSSYGALRGITQYVLTLAVALQVRSLIEESRAVFAGGAVLSVNEGIRSRPRQTMLRRAWESYLRGGPWAALAALEFTSTHDWTRGSAIDFGVTMPDGRNRALTMSEHAWVVSRGRQRGIVWTGGDPSFMWPAELWHFNVYPERATIAPIDFTPAQIPIPIPKEFDMPLVVRATQSGIVPATTKLLVSIGQSRAISGTTVRALGMDESDVYEADDKTLAVVLRDHAIPLTTNSQNQGPLNYQQGEAMNSHLSAKVDRVARKLGLK
ncbi:hypothetical protein [Frigoribacterium sp. CFBP9030]|uniref:hypothetical protein n=1 Tax=Frigoribacterium sp. CFBP9030 TaxID=3096537 RepID=UPI002A6A85A3|nr:hypothetical protein [Frigoribacterium sp. CFBP9030]MDY0891890.1 hypothetical protein [Frigoribacterium sp. CFBP9030]